MRAAQRKARFGSAWRRRHPRRVVQVPDSLLLALAPIADDLRAAGFGTGSWSTTMLDLQRALNPPDSETLFQPVWISRDYLKEITSCLPE